MAVILLWDLMSAVSSLVKTLTKFEKKSSIKFHHLIFPKWFSTANHKYKYQLQSKEKQMWSRENIWQILDCCLKIQI